MNHPQKRQAVRSSSLHDTATSAQRIRLLAALKQSAIDTITARRKLNIMHPAMRVKELRDQGHPIVTIRVDRRDDEGRWHRKVAHYVLRSGGEA